jgi:peptidoglycan-associated lipoprotein
MMRRFYVPAGFRLIPILLVAALAFAAGCASNDQPVEDPDAGMDSEFSDGSADTRVPDSSARDTAVSNALSDIDIAQVYYDFDSYEIRKEFSDVLRTAAEALRRSNANVVIEGHTDERGSDEYNMALGERRAAAVRKYLYNLGVPMKQMSIVSYGEAQPAVGGSGERVWQLNRRAEFSVR